MKQGEIGYNEVLNTQSTNSQMSHEQILKLRGSAHKHICEVENDIMQNYRDKNGNILASDGNTQSKLSDLSQKYINRQSIHDYMSDNQIRGDSIGRKSNESNKMLMGTLIEPGTQISDLNA